jgi:hypothetical protein
MQQTAEPVEAMLPSAGNFKSQTDALVGTVSVFNLGCQDKPSH